MDQYKRTTAGPSRPGARSWRCCTPWVIARSDPPRRCPVCRWHRRRTGRERLGVGVCPGRTAFPGRPQPQSRAGKPGLRVFWISLSKSDHLQAPGDFLLRDQFALSRSGTDGAGALPALLRNQVAFPEGPGPALPRPDRVDGAADALLIEDTIAIGLVAQGRSPGRQGVYSRRTSSSGSPRCLAIAASSSSLTHTYPGSPVQQSPH